MLQANNVEAHKLVSARSSSRPTQDGMNLPWHAPHQSLHPPQTQQRPYLRHAYDAQESMDPYLHVGNVRSDLSSAWHSVTQHNVHQKRRLAQQVVSEAWSAPK